MAQWNQKWGHMPPAMKSAHQLGLVRCKSCGLLCRATQEEVAHYCPRCGKKLLYRITRSEQRTWAFTIAAAICYLPANLLPVMNSTSLSGTVADTIISGIASLYASGSWHLALIVLVASICIPLAKLLALVHLLTARYNHKQWGNRERTRLYRVVRYIGRWSMLDVFVITFAVALVQFDSLMSATPGPGVIFFAAVVVLTMLAAESFDPRIIWDREQTEKEIR
ncbi:paraquat-inducible protein A [Chrysiogenes arsenatis]|uniref:paraquat-inducible protein A n=1 Tax=Chrysiogenes arsenatis TaxID=309797 RepID=UPI00191C329C|nr:paraquat-inducible protein A [Chrysiogenes arsenatis]